MDEVAQLGAGQGLVAEVVVALDEFVPEAAARVAGAQQAAASETGRGARAGGSVRGEVSIAARSAPETAGGAERGLKASCGDRAHERGTPAPVAPQGGAGLGIEVDHGGRAPGGLEGRGQVDGEGGLSRAALLGYKREREHGVRTTSEASPDSPGRLWSRAVRQPHLATGGGPFKDRGGVWQRLLLVIPYPLGAVGVLFLACPASHQDRNPRGRGSSMASGASEIHVGKLKVLRRMRIEVGVKPSKRSWPGERCRIGRGSC